MADAVKMKKDEEKTAKRRGSLYLVALAFVSSSFGTLLPLASLMQPYVGALVSLRFAPIDHSANLLQYPTRYKVAILVQCWRLGKGNECYLVQYSRAIRTEATSSHSGCISVCQTGMAVLPKQGSHPTSLANFRPASPLYGQRLKCVAA